MTEILPGISFAVLVVALLGTDVTVPRYINTSSKYLACVLEFGNYGVVAVGVVAAKLSDNDGAFSAVKTYKLNSRGGGWWNAVVLGRI